MHVHRALSIVLLAAATAACNDTTLAEKPEPPVAVITGAVSYAPLDEAFFDGSESTSQERTTIVAWEWAIVGRPNGSTSQIVPDPADPRRASFFIDLAGDYVVALTVTDDRGMSGTTELPFSAVPWQKLHVSLVWNTPGTDLDLHLVSEGEGGAFWTEPYDCFFLNTNPDWGVAGERADDPSIDIDDVDGHGPENANLNQPLDGKRYHVYVHYYDDYGQGASTATVRIYLNGELRYEGIKVLDGTGAAWDVATIDWPEGAVSDVGTSFAYTPN